MNKFFVQKMDERFIRQKIYSSTKDSFIFWMLDIQQKLPPAWLYQDFYIGFCPMYSFCPESLSYSHANLAQSNIILAANAGKVR